ncbi:DUF7507 domain-containing protein [Leifsonia sp. 22587]|uniref:DUF7507 domain-containing protein n=1 Tax=Leifsonia sp. 22587 TaxID=3453946 RepID=UPI003F875D63
MIRDDPKTARSALRRLAAASAVILLACLSAAGAAVPAQATVAGRPGVPQPPTPLYTEDFSARNATAAPIDIVDYQGTPGTVYAPGISGAFSETYSADRNWQGAGGFCNGWIVNASTPTCQNGLLHDLSTKLGRYQGMTAAAAATNQAVAAATGGNPGPGVQLLTNTPIPAVAGHFYQVTALFGEASCPNGATTALERFTLLVDGQRNVVANNLVPCTDPGRVDFGGGTVVAPLKSSVLHLAPTGSPKLQVEIYNAQGSGAGNDVAFDLPQILDVTPQLDKAFAPGSIASGGVASLTYTVTNTLELAAKAGWGFTDDLPAGLTTTGVTSSTCPAGTLTATPGGSTVTVTGGTLAAGQSSCSLTVQVTASAPGTYVNGPGNFPAGATGLNGLNPPADTALTVQPPASLVLTKSSSTTAISAVGQKIAYRFEVVNRGDVPVTGLQVVDTEAPPATQGALSPILCPVTDLPPHASTTCTATYTVTQADLDNGGVTDTATATALDPSMTTVTTPPSRLTIGVPAPGLTVTKSSTTALVSSVGQRVPYTFAVTNSGNVQLFGVQVTDTVAAPGSPGNLTPASCPEPSLAPGESEVCTAAYTATQADLANGSLRDSAVATASDVTGAAVTSAPSALSIPASLPGALSVVKSSTVTTLPAVGQPIPYTFTVTNNSAVTISNVSVTDTQQAPALPANMTPVTCAATVLAAGASTTCTGTYTVTSADANNGQVSDIAVARGTDPANAPVTSAPSTLTIAVPIATLGLVKRTTALSVSAVGQQVPYTFEVTNTGNVPVTGVAVADTPTPPSLPGNLSPVVCPQPTLAPGAQEVCTGSYTVAAADLANGSVNDSAVATGRDPSGAAVTSPQSSQSVPVQTSALTIIKSTRTDGISRVGQVLQLTFTVTNNSDVAYHDVGVVDTTLSPSGEDATGPVFCPQPVLGPRQTETCSASHVVTAADLSNGFVSDSAYAQGTDPGGAVFRTADSSLVVPVDPQPGISLVKTTTTSRIHTVGEQTRYTFTITDTGNTALTDVAVQDTVLPPATPGGLGPVDCPATSLTPGDSIDCTGTYTVTQADLDRGFVTDSATVTATAPDGSTVTSRASRVTIPAEPALALTKSSTTAFIDHAGQVVPYTFAVRNLGPGPVTGIAVTDRQLAPASPGAMSGIRCPDGTLAEGESVTCTGTYTVTQADINHGSLDDVAVASATDQDGIALPPSDPSADSIPAAQSPELTVAKSSSTSVITAAGQPVAFSYLVTNTGNTTIRDLVVADTVQAPGSPAALSPVTCLQRTLQPGERAICTADYLTTAADLANGSLSDTAVASGTDPAGATIDSPPTSLTIPAPAAAPALTIVKSSATATVTGLFDRVDYTFLVTNTGSQTVSGLQVQDTQTPPANQANLSVVTCPTQTLAPGAQTLCTARYTVTQPDLDNGLIADSATATGSTPAGPVTAQPSHVQVAVSSAAARLEVTKTTPATAVTGPGQTIPYTFTVRNSGSQTLSGLVVADTVAAPSRQSDLSAIDCPTTTLPPGATTTCSAEYTTTQADINNGLITDVASAVATTPSGSTVATQSNDVSIPASAVSGLTLTKATTTATITDAGQEIPYTFTVVNTGNQSIAGLAVTDTVAPPADPGGLSAVRCPVTSLSPAGSTTCTATYTVSQADVDSGSVTDSATATANTAGGETVTSALSTVSVPVAPHIALELAKQSTVTTVSAVGERIPYRFTVRNAGNQTLAAVTVIDTVQPPGDPAALTPVTCPSTSLAPDAELVCEASYTVTQADLDHGSVDDRAIAQGIAPGLVPVTSDAATLGIPAAQSPALTVVKSVDATGDAPGTITGYTFVVTNTGNTTLTGIAVTDTEFTGTGTSPQVACPVTTLAPGDQVVCTATYTLTQEDADNGGVRNSAVATGTAPDGSAITSPPWTAQLPIVQTPALALEKSADPPTADVAGADISYSYRVTNIGNVTVGSIAIAETAFTGTGTPPAPVCPLPTLAPGQVETCTAGYTLTQDDVDAGTVRNTAAAGGRAPDGTAVASAPSAATVTIASQSGLSLVKGTTTPTITGTGQVVPYTFTVTNTGNQTVTGLAVTDTVSPPPDPASASPVHCPATSLPPGASTVCTATYTVTQADLDSGAISDTARATAVSPAGPVDAPPAVHTVPVVPEPGLVLTKTASPEPVTEVGQRVTYTYTVTNTGNQTVTATEVTDTVAPPADPAALSPVICPAAALAPGESTACTATYTTTRADVDSGTLTNTATASAQLPSGLAVSSLPDTVELSIPAAPALSIHKSAPAFAPDDYTAGSVVTYEYRVVNAGNVTLGDLALTETLFTGTGTPPAPICPVTELPSGAATTCTATYTLTAADVSNGTTSNQATATATAPSGLPVTGTSNLLSLPSFPQPHLTLAKTVTPGTFAAGDTLEYTYTVTNTGNITVRQLGITEAAFTGTGPLPVPDCPDELLPPGGQVTCTAGYTPTAADLRGAGVTNVAVATATDLLGTSVTSGSATAVARVAEAPVVPPQTPAAPAQPSASDLASTGAQRPDGTLIAVALFAIGLGVLSLLTRHGRRRASTTV